MYNILVVDDEKDIVAALEIYLRSEGYRVLSAVTVLALSSRQIPPMTSVLVCTCPPPSCKYRRSWERTRASSSTGLKGLVI